MSFSFTKLHWGAFSDQQWCYSPSHFACIIKFVSGWSVCQLCIITFKMLTVAANIMIFYLQRTSYWLCSSPRRSGHSLPAVAPGKECSWFCLGFGLKLLPNSTNNVTVSPMSAKLEKKFLEEHMRTKGFAGALEASIFFHNCTTTWRKKINYTSFNCNKSSRLLV